ncbi:MAG: exodeoxyribonuclease VII small subunit [Bdellovibrionaceae bacterium]|jgi:exodeoxyribonuclease VII small subunit|nr:exodeoxyribonuclease VII small subunit [Pseudobdellovibrionaceae bacterium]
MEFEKKLQKLEEIVQKMEKGDLALDESLKLFQEGIALSRACQKELEEAQAQVKKLIGFDEEGRPMTENFEVTGED